MYTYKSVLRTTYSYVITYSCISVMHMRCVISEALPKKVAVACDLTPCILVEFY
jgi:hypothetical protein